ncbi:hypothetical protein ACN2AS_24275 [Serratia liquefaciens]|uniref:hypothetical protein n=1 Tax=Serratia liquefaciens TaxID=614 RepID=UPI003AF33E27
MNNIFTLNQPERAGNQYIEATPEGVKFWSMNCAGKYESKELVGYAELIQRLEAGELDDNPLGPWIFRVMAEGMDLGYHAPAVGDLLICWRHNVAQAFLIEQASTNGFAEVVQPESGIKRAVIYRGKNGSMTVYPSSVRFAMANNIEGALIGQYGQEKGTDNAVVMYCAMLNICGELSPLGHELLTDLHDGFIQQLNDEGLPSAPIAH